MNKFALLAVGLGVIIIGGVVFKSMNSTDGTMVVGEVKNITITIPKNSWSFDPEEVRVNRGDTVKLTFINEDDYDHGVGIDAYGVSQRIPARSTLQVPEFLATKAGTFQFYCSVSCGDGVAESGPHAGEKRGHFDQIGRIVIIDPNDPNSTAPQSTESAPEKSTAQ
jgi:cytochrome c oxidase subunit 2